MQRGQKEAFYWRAFVTFGVVLAFLLIAASGAVLYVAPPGRVANWSHWTLLGMQKGQWQAVHTVFALLFGVASVLHVYFNWRVILAYLARKAGSGVRRRRELALASALGAAVFALTLLEVPPFSTVMTVGETVKASWSGPATEPPVPHAETWTLAKFAEETKVPVERAIQNLRQAGMPAAGAASTLQALGDTYHVTPREVYAKALGEGTPARAPLAEGGGYGMKTVRQVAEQAETPLGAAIQRLHDAGFTDAAGDSNIRALASAHGRKPFDLVQIIQGRRIGN